MLYFIPATKLITLPNGAKHRLIRGVGEVPHAFADTHEANAHGIKPAEEMTDAEWLMLGLKKPEPKKAEAVAEDVAKHTTDPVAEPDETEAHADDSHVVADGDAGSHEIPEGRDGSAPSA